MKNKTIAFFDSYSDASGGAPKSMLTLASLMTSNGYWTKIYTSQDDSLVVKAKSENIESVVIGISKILMVRRKDQKKNLLFVISYLAALFHSWFSCIKYLPLLKDDKVCFNDIRCFLFFLPIAVYKRKDLIWYVRINDRVKFITFLATKLSAKIILISSSCYSMFTTEETLEYKSKISIVHTGFSIPQNLIFDKQEKFTLGFVGVLSKRKNIELVIESVKLLDSNIKKRLNILVVGSSKPDENAYEVSIIDVIERNNLSEVFTFVGYQENVTPFYNKMDAVLLTSFSEGLPRVIIEGLSHGCFALSTNVDGIVDIVKSNSLGSIVQDYSPSDMSLAILNAFNIRDELNSGRSIRSKYIEENFSEKSFVKNFINSVW